MINNMPDKYDVEIAGRLGFAPSSTMRCYRELITSNLLRMLWRIAHDAMKNSERIQKEKDK